MNSSFQKQEGLRRKSPALTIALSFMALLLLATHFWHVTKCNIHTAAQPAFSNWTLSPSLTHKLLSLPQSQSQTHVFFHISLPHYSSFPASISNKLHSACTKLSFVLLLDNNTICFARAEHRDAAWQALRLGRPCLLLVILCASAVTSEGHYLP